MNFKINILLLVSILIAGSNCYAAELRVLDPVGLIRAVQVVQAKGKISLKLEAAAEKSNLPAFVVLSNSDGLASEIHAKSQGGGRYIAEDVAPGTWKIILPGNSFEVQDVKVVE